MFHSLRFTWIAWLQLAGIACTVPVTIVLTVKSIQEARATYHFTRALEMYGAGNNSQAIEHVDSTIDVDEEFTPAYEMKARILLDENQAGQAKQVYKKILEIDSNNFGAKLGLAATIMKDLELRLTASDTEEGSAPPTPRAIDEDGRKQIEEARKHLEEALKFARAKSQGEYSDAHVYLGLLTILESPNDPMALQKAEEEFEKAKPRAKPRPLEIPSTEAMIRMYNGLGFIYWKRSAERWAEVDKLRNEWIADAPGLVAPTELDARVLEAANRAAEVSYECAGNFLSATQYGALYREAFINFEMAMTAYLPREELKATTTRNIGDFVTLGWRYAEAKADIWTFYKSLIGEDNLRKRFGIHPGNLEEFDENSYNFSLAMAVGGVIAARWDLASDFLTRAKTAHYALVEKENKQRWEWITVDIYYRANEFTGAKLGDPKLLAGIMDPYYQRQRIEEAYNYAADLATKWNEQSGVTKEIQAWAWAMAGYLKFVRAVLADQNLYMMIDAVVQFEAGDYGAMKYSQADWLRRMRDQVKWHTWNSELVKPTSDPTLKATVEKYRLEVPEYPK